MDGRTKRKSDLKEEESEILSPIIPSSGRLAESEMRRDVCGLLRAASCLDNSTMTRGISGKSAEKTLISLFTKESTKSLLINRSS